MTRKELRMEFKFATGKYPYGEQSMRGEELRIHHSDDLSDYLDWLEQELIKHKKLKKSLIPWEPLDF